MYLRLLPIRQSWVTFFNNNNNGATTKNNEYRQNINTMCSKIHTAITKMNYHCDTTPLPEQKKQTKKIPSTTKEKNIQTRETQYSPPCHLISTPQCVQTWTIRRTWDKRWANNKLELLFLLNRPHHQQWLSRRRVDMGRLPTYHIYVHVLRAILPVQFSQNDQAEHPWGLLWAAWGAWCIAHKTFYRSVSFKCGPTIVWHSN